MKVNLNNASPVVLVLDIQRLFTDPDGPFENKTAGKTIGALNAFLGQTRALGLPVIFSRYVLRDDLSDAGLLRGMPFVEAGQFSERASWMRLDERLEIADGDLHLQRNRPSAFFRSDLESQLSSLGADTLILTGVSVNNAISSTARDAFALDIPTLVVRECTGAAPWETEMETYFTILDTWAAEVDTADNVIERLNSATVK